jgi:hypothetical protein
VQLGLPLVVELPSNLMSATHFSKDFSAHLDRIVQDAFSQSQALNKGSSSHRFTSLNPIVYIRLYYCGEDVVENVLRASKACPLWFSQQIQGNDTITSEIVPCNPILGDALHPEPRRKLRNAAKGIQAGVNLFIKARRRSLTRAASDGHSDAAPIAAQEKIQLPVVVNNVPLQRKLSVKILLHKTVNDSATSKSEFEAQDIVKFRQLFESSKAFPTISIVGSDKRCSVSDVLEWSATIASSSRSYIIMDIHPSSGSRRLFSTPEAAAPVGLLAVSPSTAVEFAFGACQSEKNMTKAFELKDTESDCPMDFKKMLQIYHGLYQGFISSLYRDTVLLCNLCSKPPPHEMSVDYKSLCHCMYTILESPLLVKDIENALSSTSFQSLEPRQLQTETGFVWSSKPQNIFWKGVFAGSIFLDLNELLIDRDNKSGLLKLRWNDSLKRVVKHYENIGDNNLWARSGRTILFAHEQESSKHNDHDLHRLLFFLLLAFEKWSFMHMLYAIFVTLLASTASSHFAQDVDQHCDFAAFD